MPPSRNCSSSSWFLPLGRGGLIGSLVGFGGGVFVVPLLTLAFGVPIQEAIGASIVSVIATSSGAPPPMSATA